MALCGHSSAHCLLRCPRSSHAVRQAEQCEQSRAACTHRPLQHDLGVTDGFSVSNVGPGDGAAGEAVGEACDLVGAGRGAAGALPVVVHSDHTELIHLSLKGKKGKKVVAKQAPETGFKERLNRLGSSFCTTSN